MSERVQMISALWLSCCAAVFGWLKWLFELREKRKERNAKEQEKAAKERAEAELKIIRRRALETAPYLAPAEERFNGIEVKDLEDGKFYWFPAGHLRVLSAFRDEVDKQNVKTGMKVYLIVSNRGSNAEEVRFTLDGQPCRMDAVDARAFQLNGLIYIYDAALHGKEQVIEMNFLAPNGVRDTHRYRTRHGVRILKRIDPA